VLADAGLETWDDRDIAAGDDWLPAIEDAIAHCDVALLLVPRHFLTSPFIRGQEVPPLLQRRQEEGIRVIPVILSPCQWTKVPWLKPIQARPKDGQPLSGMTEHDAEAALSDLAGEVHDLTRRLSPGRQPGTPVPPDRIDLRNLPRGADHFQGRQSELAALDQAWAESGYTEVAELIAPGGVGKTALVRRWLQRLKDDGWRGAQSVFAWRFDSQGTGDERQASDEHFLSEALAWFGVEHDPALNPADKGRLLAEAVTQGRTLLVLDGVEPLQYPPSPLAGGPRAPGLKALLEHLVTAGHAGLCLVTSREALVDLNAYRRTEAHPEGAVLRLDLGNLDAADGARLLHDSGVQKAGPAAIGPEDDELKETSRRVRGHALTLSLLGRYLALAFEGDIRRRDQVDLGEADQETGGHAFKVMAAYETWLAREGKQGARELAALRLLGFFDRPASPDSLAALRAAPAIAGVTEPLVDLGPHPWRMTLKRLEACGLVYPSEGKDPALDAHPMVREHLARAPRRDRPEAWREGHRRVYEQLEASVPHHPEGLAGLQPLYQAVAHGCQAGRQREACAEVYDDRILRGTGHGGFYSTRKLGAIGADLGAVACFFEEPWRRPSPALGEGDQTWLLNDAAFSLRALGRLEEALEPMRAGAEMWVKQEDWKNAAASYGNLSELQLTLGRVAAARADAARSVDYADRSGEWRWRVATRTTQADALHQHGEGEAAAARFQEVEAMQAERQPQYPLLYSLQGFRYCGLLLAGAERAAWDGERGGRPWSGAARRWRSVRRRL
jgi:hypothetical protein